MPDSSNTSRHRRLERLPRLDESGEQRVAVVLPHRVGAQQQPVVSVGNEHDHRGIGAGEHLTAIWAWPSNRRLLYNRASADPDGKPWSDRKAYVWWDDDQGKWTGHDVPDFIVDRPPSYRPAEDAEGIETIAGDTPFIMQADGRGWLYAAHRRARRAAPHALRAARVPFDNPLYRQQRNPARMEWNRVDNPYHRPFGDPEHPYVITTYRLTEHHTAGGMSRWLPWLSELQPELFCEVSPELAADRGLRNGEWATISTARAEIEARVLVTSRIPPLRFGSARSTRSGCPTTGRARDS